MDVTLQLLLIDYYCNNIALSQSETVTPQTDTPQTDTLQTDTPQNRERGQVCRNVRPQYYQFICYCYIIGWILILNCHSPDFHPLFVHYKLFFSVNINILTLTFNTDNTIITSTGLFLFHYWTLSIHQQLLHLLQQEARRTRRNI